MRDGSGSGEDRIKKLDRVMNLKNWKLQQKDETEKEGNLFCFVYRVTLDKLVRR